MGMSPGGYLRGAAALEGPPEIVRPPNYQKSVYIALTFLALLQVGCTLGLFLYVKVSNIVISPFTKLTHQDMDPYFQKSDSLMRLENDSHMAGIKISELCYIFENGLFVIDSTANYY